MIVTQEGLNELEEFNAVAKGMKTGIFDWKTADKLVTGYPDNKHKGFSNGREAVKYLLYELSLRAKVEVLNADELETLNSCKKLVGDWEKEADRWSLI